MYMHGNGALDVWVVGKGAIEHLIIPPLYVGFRIENIISTDQSHSRHAVDRLLRGLRKDDLVFREMAESHGSFDVIGPQSNQLCLASLSQLTIVQISFSGSGAKLFLLQLRSLVLGVGKRSCNSQPTCSMLRDTYSWYYPISRIPTLSLCAKKSHKPNLLAIIEARRLPT